MDKRCISRLLFLSSSHETGSSLAGPFVFYFGGIGAYNMMSSKMEGYDVFTQTLGNLWFWLAVPLISAVAVLPTWCYFFAAKRFFPNDDEEVLRMARELGEVRRPAKKKRECPQARGSEANRAVGFLQDRAREQNERRALPATVPLPPSFKNCCSARRGISGPQPGLVMSA